MLLVVKDLITWTELTFLIDHKQQGYLCFQGTDFDVYLQQTYEVNLLLTLFTQ